MKAAKGHRRVVQLSVFVWIILSCTTGSNAQFAGGTGEPNDPYQIATAAQLAAIRGMDPALGRKHYVLTASIDLSGVTQSEAMIPLFWGTLDGNGYTIRSLRIEGSNTRALIDLMDRMAEVRNLGVVDVYVSGGSRPAALVSNNMGRVTNCYSTGTVIGDGFAGGLVAMNWGTVTDSYSTVTVEGTVHVGGLIAENSGALSFCHSTGDVVGTDTVGGLVGMNTGTITSSYCAATVWAMGRWTGGLVGYNSGKITSSYADATVTGEYEFVGGLVGDNGGVVSSCYSTGSVTGEDMVGGLVGISGGKIITSYSAATVLGYGRRDGGLVGLLDARAPKVDPAKDCYFLDPADGGGVDNGIGTPLTSEEMKQQSSFVGWDFWGISEDGMNDVWFMPKNAYPILAWQEATGLRRVPEVSGMSLDQAKAALTAAGFVTGNISHDFHRTISMGDVIHAVPHGLAPAGSSIDLVVSSGEAYDWSGNPGDGTPGNPYQIQTAGQLEALVGRMPLWDKCFVLTADLDMTGRTYLEAPIAPDANYSQSGFQGTPFSGTFDGQCHTIRNLTIRSDTKHDYLGLFGMIARSGRIQDLHLVDAEVKGGSGSRSYVGVVAGYNNGTVVNCSASGVVDGGKGDGFVGFNGGSVIDCQVDIARI
ncbi:MAG: PASTA domain-containing protein [Sedimentisphaerales bacterium]|nr:PASTA domain-containing protein [Sedimentisphaerales bacterium]